MKISYGTPSEKRLLCGIFLLAAAVSAVVLHRAEILEFPFLSLPIYLALCAVVLACLPRARPSGDPISRWLYRALPALLLMSAIFHASSFSIPSGPTVTLPDYLFHFGEFFTLGLLTARMVSPNSVGKLSLRSFLLAASIVLGYGLLDEIHQSFVPERVPSGQDLLVDAIAGLLGILVYPAIFTGRVEEA